MNVYIGTDDMSPVSKVKKETAEKMMKVYHEAQKFEPIKVNAYTYVIVNKYTKGYEVEITCTNYPDKCFSIDESRKLRAALEKAENWVIVHND